MLHKCLLKQQFLLYELTTPFLFFTSMNYMYESTPVCYWHSSLWERKTQTYLIDSSLAIILEHFIRFRYYRDCKYIKYFYKNGNEKQSHDADCTYKLLQHTEGQLSNLTTLQLTESFQPDKSTIYNAPQIFHKKTSILESKLSSVAVKPRNVIVMEHRWESAVNFNHYGLIVYNLEGFLGHAFLKSIMGIRDGRDK